jgi:hypothetical protein
LLEEEMRRAVEYCWYLAREWDKRKQARSHPDPHVAEGLRAYVAEQAAIERERGQRWFTSWGSIRHRAKEVLEKKLGEVEEDLDVPDIIIPDDENLDNDMYVDYDDT